MAPNGEEPLSLWAISMLVWLLSAVLLSQASYSAVRTPVSVLGRLGPRVTALLLLLCHTTPPPISYYAFCFKEQWLLTIWFITAWRLPPAVEAVVLAVEVLMTAVATLLLPARMPGVLQGHELKLQLAVAVAGAAWAMRPSLTSLRAFRSSRLGSSSTCGKAGVRLATKSCQGEGEGDEATSDMHSRGPGAFRTTAPTTAGAPAAVSATLTISKSAGSISALHHSTPPDHLHLHPLTIAPETAAAAAAAIQSVLPRSLLQQPPAAAAQLTGLLTQQLRQQTYVSRLGRTTVHVKVPFAEPEDLPGDFLLKIQHAMDAKTGGAFVVTGAAVRRGCIELTLDVVRTWPLDPPAAGHPAAAAPPPAAAVAQAAAPTPQQQEHQHQHQHATHQTADCGCGCGGDCDGHGDGHDSSLEDDCDCHPCHSNRSSSSSGCCSECSGDSSTCSTCCCALEELPPSDWVHWLYLQPPKDAQVLVQACGRAFVTCWDADSQQWNTRELPRGYGPDGRPLSHSPSRITTAHPSCLLAAAAAAPDGSAAGSQTVLLKGCYLGCPDTSIAARFHGYSLPVQVAPAGSSSHSVLLTLPVLYQPGLLQLECWQGKLMTGRKNILVAADPEVAAELALLDQATGDRRPEDLITDLGCWMEYVAAVRTTGGGSRVDDAADAPAPPSSGGGFPSSSASTRRSSSAQDVQSAGAGARPRGAAGSRPESGHVSRRSSGNSKSAPSRQASGSTAAAGLSTQLLQACRFQEYQHQMRDVAVHLLEHCCSSGWHATAGMLLRDLLDTGHSFAQIKQMACGDGVTLLHRAACSGSQRMVQLVVAWGVAHGEAWDWGQADPTSGITPLHIAAASGSSAQHLQQHIYNQQQQQRQPHQQPHQQQRQGSLADWILQEYEAAWQYWHGAPDASGSTPADVAKAYASQPPHAGYLAVAAPTVVVAAAGAATAPAALMTAPPTAVAAAAPEVAAPPAPAVAAAPAAAAAAAAAADAGARGVQHRNFADAAGLPSMPPGAGAAAASACGEEEQDAAGHSAKVKPPAAHHHVKGHGHTTVRHRTSVASTSSAAGADAATAPAAADCKDAPAAAPPGAGAWPLLRATLLRFPDRRDEEAYTAWVAQTTRPLVYIGTCLRLMSVTIVVVKELLMCYAVGSAPAGTMVSSALVLLPQAVTLGLLLWGYPKAPGSSSGAGGSSSGSLEHVWVAQQLWCIAARSLFSAGVLPVPGVVQSYLAAGLDAVSEGFLPMLFQPIRMPSAVLPRFMYFLVSAATYSSLGSFTTTARAWAWAATWNAAVLLGGTGMDWYRRRAFVAKQERQRGQGQLQVQGQRQGPGLVAWGHAATLAGKCKDN